MVPPSIDTSAAVQRCKGPFQSLAEAQACVEGAVSATDDCQPVTITVVASGSEGAIDFEVVATEDNCNKSTVGTVSTYVDSTPPSISCSFAKSKIRRSGRLTDAEFSYSVEDGSGEPLSVTVDVFSNEYNLRDDIAFFFKNDNTNDRAELFVDAEVCKSSGQPALCIQEDAVQYARVYTAVVSAVDSAGNKAETECKVQIECQGSPCKKADASKSVQRFPVASYTSVFN